MQSPSQKSIEKDFKNIFRIAGIEVNGKNSWDMKVHDPSVYARVLSKGSIGLGETYVEGLWDCDRLDIFFEKVLSAKIAEKVKPLSLALGVIKSKVINLQSKKRAFQVGVEHYDIGNDLYKSMLGKRMVYTCAYYKNTKSLDKAQENKLDLVCKKIGLKKGQKVLDIGGGWGSFAKFAAQKYGAKVVAITISKEQVKLGKELCKGIKGIEIRLQDYRDLVKNGKATEKFDHVISLGMFEHVGVKNYRTYMKVVKKVLNPGGLFLLHTIGNDKSKNIPDPWIVKYIFPNGSTPTAKQLTTAVEDIFRIEDWHNFGAYYDLTLMDWHKNFNKSWNKLKKDYDENFFRMWNYYLTCCAGAFRARATNLWQIVLSPRGVPGGYKSIR